MFSALSDSTALLPPSAEKQTPDPAVRLQAAIDLALREALHALAQPLTILQSRVEAEILASHVIAERQEFLETIAGEVERLCALLRPLQQLASARESGAREWVDPAEAMQAAYGRLHRVFEDSCLRIDLDLPAPAAKVLVSPSAFQGAIEATLTALHAVSARGGRASVAGKAVGDTVVLTFSGNPASARLSSLQKLHLTIAAIRIMASGGEMCVSYEPLLCTMRFPVPVLRPSV